MFTNRREAGVALARKLGIYQGKKNVVVLGIPRGGVVVAAELAQRLHLPLDILVIKKIGAPGQEELAIGAVGTQGHHLNEHAAHLPRAYLQEQIKLKQQEVQERYKLLRGKRKAVPWKGKVVLLTDDGVATGATMIMAIQMLRKQGVKKMHVAVPVAPRGTVQRLKVVADEVICLEQPAFFHAIGEFYKDFKQVEDEEVIKILQEAGKRGKKHSGKSFRP